MAKREWGWVRGVVCTGVDGGGLIVGLVREGWVSGCAG